MVHSFEGIKENLQYIEKEMAVLTEFPGIRNRVEQLEGYLYSGSETEGKSFERKLITDVEKETASIPGKKDVVVFRASVKKPEKVKAQKIKDYLMEDNIEDEITESGMGRKFRAVTHNVALIQDLERKRHAPKFKSKELFEEYEDEDDYSYEEPVYDEVPEKPKAKDFGALEEVPFHDKDKATEYPEAKIKTGTFTSPDVLEEYSHRLKGQVIVFVKKRLYDFEIDLQRIEGNLVSVERKMDILEIFSKDLNEKLTFMDANFSQRVGDLTTLKELAGNHQASIKNIMHHLERKAEAYAVNEKVSRKELTVIEDRVLKLCMRASTEITKMAEKMDDSLEKLNLELDKKLFTGDYQLREEFLLHKLKVLGNKLKDLSIENTTLDYDGIRPIEVKKYVMSKDGRKLRSDRRKIPTWNSPDNIIPVITQNYADVEASPKTAAQIQQELELASSRESKRFVEGAYTKVKIGRKRQGDW